MLSALGWCGQDSVAAVGLSEGLGPAGEACSERRKTNQPTNQPVEPQLGVSFPKSLTPDILNGFHLELELLVLL